MQVTASQTTGLTVWPEEGDRVRLIIRLYLSLSDGMQAISNSKI